jgi:tetratricopeptide (TPR) repeat protein
MIFLSLLVSMLLFITSGAFAASTAYQVAADKFDAVANSLVDDESNTRDTLEKLLAVDSATLTDVDQAHVAMYIGDLYYRLGDYEKCQEWLLKVLDTKKLYDSPVEWNSKYLYPHGLAAAVMLANAAATQGKPEDIDALEKKLSTTDLSTRVSLWYCWGGRPRNTLGTLLDFYKALAYKNAGQPDEAQQILEASDLRDGDIRIGNKIEPLAQAVDSYLVGNKTVELSDHGWLVRIPNTSKILDNKYRKVEPINDNGGIKYLVKKEYGWWCFHVYNIADRKLKHWEIRATIEHGNAGGSGVMFGDAEKEPFMALYLSGNKLTLARYQSKAKAVVLAEVSVKPEDQKQPGTMIMHATIERDTGVIKCSVNGTPYLEADVSGKVKPFPEIEDYGFFTSAENTGRPVSNIYRRIEVRGEMNANWRKFLTRLD